MEQQKIENIIEFGDCRETMARWATQGVKVQTCVTSPPYYGLRDYGHDGQIGLEETPTAYINAMVDVFAKVWDILADDGTLWINIGDSYAGSNGNGSKPQTFGQSKYVDFDSPTGKVEGVRPKNLIGIPWKLAFALQDFGWNLRQDIIWHKPNPMPESVADRCTKAHEYIFLLSKKPHYYFDNESIKEPATTTDNTNRDRDTTKLNNTPGRTKMKGLKTNHYTMRNKRSVWTVNTKPYKGAHFATYPIELIEPCILSSSRVGDIVFDPFMGSGTTAQAAVKNGRKYLGCELNNTYRDLQQQRINSEGFGESNDLFEIDWTGNGQT